MDQRTSGALSGAASGAALGSSILPGWGTAIGAVGGGLVGLFSSKNTEVPQAPPSIDPMQQQMLDELITKRRAIEMGTSTEFQTAREIIQRSEATGLSNISRVTGGDVGGAVAASERIINASGNNVSKLVGQADQMASPYTQMINNLIDKMSQRKLELGMAARMQGMAEKTQAQANTNANLSAALNSKALAGGLYETGSGISKWVQDLFSQPSVVPEQIMKPVPYANVPVYGGDLESSLQSHYGMDNSMDNVSIGG